MGCKLSNTAKKYMGRYQIKCPICSRRLQDCREGIKAHVCPANEVREADFFAKCRHCGNEIAIIKVS